MNSQRKVLLKIESTSNYGRGLQLGVSKYARLRSNWLFYRTPPFYIPSGGINSELERIRKWKPTGVIIREAKPVPDILKLNIPTIISRNVITSPRIQKLIKGMPAIVTDGIAIGEMAAEYLLNRNFKNYAFCGYTEVEWSHNRFRSFNNKIEQAGFTTHMFKSSITRKLDDWEKEIKNMANWLKSLPKPLAVMACNDMRALDILDACHLADTSVPEEIAVLGVDDDTTVCMTSNPNLSSIAISAEKAGYEAAKLLDQMMSKKNFANKNILVKPLFVKTRQSTDVMAIEDLIVSKAISFIRQNVSKQIQVINVADELSISRRNLEIRFKKELGRSVYNEIKRVKIEKIRQALVETHLTISEVVTQYGFTDIHNMSRYFRKHMGISMLEYRKRYR